MNTELEALLVTEIKQKRTFQGLPDEFLKSKLNHKGKQEFELLKKLEKEFEEKGKTKILKNKHFKELVKKTREEIGIVYGSFLTKEFTKKEKKIKEVESLEETNELLFYHKSTRERVEFYEEIYSNIESWHTPKKIADLACGLNPLSYQYLKSKPEYVATDLNEEDMEFVQSFFDKFSIPGKAFANDITTLDILENEEVQSADLIFLFKALDSFEKVKRHISKELLSKLKAKKVVVSFPTQSLVAKEEFDIKKRNWLFNFIEKEGWRQETFFVDNELFILISKD